MQRGNGRQSANVFEALCVASRDPTFKHLHTATHGIIFLGTPHQGSSLAETGITFANMVRYAYPKIRTQLLEALKQDSPTLQDLADDFRHLYPEFEIVSCYERQPTKYGIVSVTSSELGDENNGEFRSLTKTRH
jgi:hypothetical protein